MIYESNSHRSTFLEPSFHSRIKINNGKTRGLLCLFSPGQCRWSFTLLVLILGIWGQLEHYPGQPAELVVSPHITPFVCANGFRLPAPTAQRVSAGRKRAQPERRVGQKPWGATTPAVALTNDKLKWVDRYFIFLASQNILRPILYHLPGALTGFNLSYDGFLQFCVSSPHSLPLPPGRTLHMNSGSASGGIQPNTPMFLGLWSSSVMWNADLLTHS